MLSYECIFPSQLYYKFIENKVFLLSVCLPYIYPQLNQNELVRGSKLGIVNKLNWGIIIFFLLVLMTTVAQGHIYY